MKVFHGLTTLKLDRKHSVLTIGNFDGVHLGHQELLNETIRIAKENVAESSVYTFRPHPQEVLRPGVKVELLTTYSEKLEVLENIGIDTVVEELFSQDFFSQSAEQFFKSVIVDGFQASHLIIGYDFKFGKNREGNSETLKSLCEKYKVKLTFIGAKKVEDEICSSSKIRTLLREGKIKEASQFLGRSFFYRGIVRKGDQRGRLLGFPTANMRIENKLELPNGVYVTESIIKRGLHKGKYSSVTNIGIRPTFKEEGEKLIETHFILADSQNFDIYGFNIYGEEVEVQFLSYLREEKKFSSFEELKSQIMSDKEQVKHYFGI